MKGKKGGESATSGVTFTTSAIPCTSKGNILAAAKKRKRGGAVAMKVEGDAPKARLDKPKRARGGAADDSNVSRQKAKAASQLSGLMSSRASAPKSSDAAGAAAMKMMETKMPKRASGGKVDDDKPKRARGGQIGADTKPMSHAATKRPMRGHATQPNIT